MSGFARHLPLSGRDTSGEIATSNDWRPLAVECLTMVTGLLRTLTPEQWDQQSAREGWRVREVAGELAWQLTATPLMRTRLWLADVLRGGVTRHRFELLRRARAGGLSPDALVATLLRSAETRLPRHSGRGIRQLTEIVVCGYDIASPLGATLPFPHIATGAVAVARSLSAPVAVTSLVKSRTFRAADAGWSVGRGPEVAAPAVDIIRFLFRRAAPPSR